MSHNITALILKGGFDRQKAAGFDLIPKDIGFGLTLFHIDHYYSFYWQHKLGLSGELEVGKLPNFPFPVEMSVAEIVARVSTAAEAEFAIIQTDYFGGMGFQHAAVFRGNVNADTSIDMISPALRHLGVIAKDGIDEFDTVGLDQIRSNPDILDKYADLVEQYGY